MWYFVIKYFSQQKTISAHCMASARLGQALNEVKTGHALISTFFYCPVPIFFNPCSNISAATQWMFTNSPSFLFWCKTLLSAIKQPTSACYIIYDTAINAFLTESPECLSHPRHHSKLRAKKAYAIFSVPLSGVRISKLSCLFTIFFHIVWQAAGTHISRKIMKKLFLQSLLLYFSLLKMTQTPVQISVLFLSDDFNSLEEIVLCVLHMIDLAARGQIL